MQKIWAAIFIAIFVTSLAVTETIQILSTTDKVSENIEKSLAYYEQGIKDKSIEEISTAQKTWKEKKSIIDIFFYHDTVDNVGTSLTSAMELLKADIDDFPVECEKAKEQLSNIRDAQLPRWENIL